jgi:Skp family chaperone for outer membrane proteins
MTASRSPSAAPPAPAAGTTPAASAPGVLVVDVDRVLDESGAGRSGAQALQARFDEARAAWTKLRERGSSPQGQKQAEEAARAFEAEALAGLEAERAVLRAQVMAALRPVAQAVLRERGGAVVVDARACLAVVDGIDVTDEVVRRLV